LALMFLMGFSLLVLLMFDKLGRQPLQAASLTLLGFFYIPFMLSFYLRLAQWGVKDPFCFSSDGIFLAFYMSAIVKLGDVGAFGVGMACGRHKMIPRISPAKSWEGLAGGLSSSVLASVLILLVLRFFPAIPAGPLSGMPLWLGAVIGLALGIVGTLGDLVESMFKRELSAKDSSRIFPGMGGVLDVFDSLIFTPALFYLILVCYVK